MQDPPKSVAKILKMTGVLNLDHEKPVTHFSVSLNVLFTKNCSNAHVVIFSLILSKNVKVVGVAKV